MRWARQFVWIWLAGWLLGPATLVAHAGQRGAWSRRPLSSHCEKVVWPAPWLDVDPFDDDVPGDVDPACTPPRLVFEAFSPDPALSRAPVTVRNRPAPRRLKVPAPSGEDAPVA